MRKILSFLIASMITCSFGSCGKKNESATIKTPDITKAAPVKSDGGNFSKYVSNTYAASGNNSLVENAESVTYRAYFPVEEYGGLEYCFYFSNMVDSTYSDGSLAHVGLAGGDYTIESAYIADGGTSIDQEITNRQAVTFDGNAKRNVSAGETFWSDALEFDVPEEHYLVWEWTLTGENIPATSVSNLTKVGADHNDGKGLVYCDDIPLPQLIGADRQVKYTVSAIGDSITQGCQTEFMAYEYWAAQISQKLGSEYSLWNCGLGWARTSDAALCGDWLQRAAASDIVIVAFGTNDIISGEFGGDGGNSADEIDGYIRTVLDFLKKEQCSVIVFNAPPEDYRDNLEAVRTEYNEKLKSTCEEYGVSYFDFAGLLSDESEPSKALYGGHPNGEGGEIVSEEFLRIYKDYLDIK